MTAANDSVEKDAWRHDTRDGGEGQGDRSFVRTPLRHRREITSGSGIGCAKRGSALNCEFK